MSGNTIFSRGAGGTRLFDPNRRRSGGVSGDPPAPLQVETVDSPPDSINIETGRSNTPPNVTTTGGSSGGMPTSGPPPVTSSRTSRSRFPGFNFGNIFNRGTPAAPPAAINNPIPLTGTRQPTDPSGNSSSSATFSMGSFGVPSGTRSYHPQPQVGPPQNTTPTQANRRRSVGGGQPAGTNPYYRGFGQQSTQRAPNPTYPQPNPTFPQPNQNVGQPFQPQPSGGMNPVPPPPQPFHQPQPVPQHQPVQHVVTPRVGGVTNGVVWTGGCNTRRAYIPSNVNQYRPQDYKNRKASQDAATKGLAEEYRLKLASEGTGPSVTE